VRSTKNGGYSSKHICVFEQNKNLHCCSFVDCLRLKTRTSQSCKVYVEQELYCNHWSISHFQLMWLRAVNTFCYCHQLVASAYTSCCCSVPLPIRIAGGGRKAQSPQSCGGTKALSPRSWGGTKAQRSPRSCGGRKAQSPQSCWRVETQCPGRRSKSHWGHAATARKTVHHLHHRQVLIPGQLLAACH
jgi:hypothetical protein